MEGGDDAADQSALVEVKKTLKQAFKDAHAAKGDAFLSRIDTIFEQVNHSNLSFTTNPSDRTIHIFAEQSEGYLLRDPIYFTFYLFYREPIEYSYFDAKYTQHVGETRALNYNTFGAEPDGVYVRYRSNELYIARGGYHQSTGGDGYDNAFVDFAV